MRRRVAVRGEYPGARPGIFRLLLQYRNGLFIAPAGGDGGKKTVLIVTFFSYGSPVLAGISIQPGAGCDTVRISSATDLQRAVALIIFVQHRACGNTVPIGQLYPEQLFQDLITRCNAVQGEYPLTMGNAPGKAAFPFHPFSHSIEDGLDACSHGNIIAPAGFFPYPVTFRLVTRCASPGPVGSDAGTFYLPPFDIHRSLLRQEAVGQYAAVRIGAFYAVSILECFCLLSCCCNGKTKRNKNE